MVQIASNTGDGAVYDIPFFKLAGGLAAKLQDAPVPGSEGAHSLATAFEQNINTMKHDGKPFRSVKAIPTGNMHYETVLALSAALQDTYDHLPGERPPVRFFSSIAVEYKQDGRTKVHLACFEPEQWQSEETRGNLKALFENMESASEQGAHIGVLPFIVAASTEPELHIPAEQIKKSLLQAQERMFDHERYKFGDHPINGEEYVAGLKLMNPSESEAADRLLPLVAQVYGGEVIIRETKKGEAYILPDVAFEAMERGEMPSRYKGMDRDD